MPHKIIIEQTHPSMCISVIQVANILGVPVKDVYAWRLNGTIPKECSLKIGRRVLFSRQRILEFIESQLGASSSEKAKKLANEIYNASVGSSSTSRRKEE